MEDIQVMCKKSGNKVPSSHLKLDLDLKMVVCPDCVKGKKIHKEIETEVFHKDNPTKPIQSSVIEEKASRLAHKCTSCGYKFEIDPETSKPKNCPYCNARVMGF